MNKNTLYVLIGIAAVLLIGAVLARSTPSSTVVVPSTNTMGVVTSTSPTPASTTTTAMTASSTTMTPPKATSTPPVTTPPVAAPNTYTMAQVSTHSTGSSCWTTLRGNVYDVTNWINRHPGGSDAILSLCGKDGASAFEDQHGGQRRPEQELASFKIGTLIK